MPSTDMSENALEALIVESLTGRCKADEFGRIQQGLGGTEAGYLGEQFYVQGHPKDYDREYALDLAKL